MQKLSLRIILMVVLPGSVGLALFYQGINYTAVSGNEAPAVIQRTVTDMTGHQVELPESPQRVLSLSAMANDIIVKLGLAERLVAIDRYGQIISGVDHAEIVGRDCALSIEKIVALKIDLAFVWWYQESAAVMLQKHGIPVVRLNSCRLENYVDVVELVGDCFNANHAASNITRVFLEQLESLTLAADVKRPKVYLELYTPYKTVGRGTYVNDLLKVAGAKNIAGQLNGAVLLSGEEIVKKSPEIIIYIKGFGNAEEIASRPGFHVLRAVKQQRIKNIERHHLVAGANPVGAVEAIRKLIHGETHPRAAQTAAPLLQQISTH